MAKILLVEDDEFFTMAMQSVLEGEGHAVVVAGDGRAAIEQIQIHKFDCIFTDVQMPGMTGIELAKWVHENVQIPTVLMTGYSDSLTTQQANGLNVRDLLIKPFSHDEVLLVLHKALAPISEIRNAEQKSVDGQLRYSKVPTNLLKRGGTAEFNLYQEINGSMVKVVSRGEIYSPNMAAIENNRYLYTENESLARLVEMSVMVGKAAGRSSKVDIAVKSAAIEDALEIVSEKALAFGLEQNLLDDCVDMVACYLQSFNSATVWDLIRRIEKDDKFNYDHTLAVTAFSLLVANLRAISIDQCYVLTAASLFHDIGLRNVEPRVLETSPPLRSVADRAKYEAHVVAGLEILQKTGVISRQVCEIVYQHHENLQGSGYPRRLKSEEISAFARILRAVDEFCELISPGGGRPKFTVAQALSQMEKSNSFDQTVVSDLAYIVTAKLLQKAL